MVNDTVSIVLVSSVVASGCWTAREFRAAARKAAGLRASDSAPVHLIPGASAPVEVGESFHWRTRGGTRIHHPRAYSRKGWSNCVYVASTRHVRVGADWTPST